MRFSLHRTGAYLVGLALISCLAAPGLPDNPPQGAESQASDAGDPVDLGTTEKTTVRLVLVDVVVLDRDDRTVPDLTAEDFEVWALGESVTVDTLDLDCPIGAADEPHPTRKADAREALPAPSAGRRIVLAFDYLHLNQFLREESIVAATKLVRDGSSGQDELLVIALNCAAGLLGFLGMGSLN